MGFYHKYEKQLKAAGYTVEESGCVRDSMGNQAAAEDAYGNVQCKDPNVTEICRKAEESGVLNKVKKAAKKAAPKLKKVRARNADGTLRGDDPSTPDVNEAWTYVEDK